MVCDVLRVCDTLVCEELSDCEPARRGDSIWLDDSLSLLPSCDVP